MKKLTLKLVFFFILSTIYSQNTIVDKPLSSREEGRLHIQSSLDVNDNTGVFLADSFILDEETALGELDLRLTLTNQGLLADSSTTGFSVYIYEDNNGVPNGNPSLPGTEIVALSNISSNFYSLEEIQDSFFNTDVNITSIKLTQANEGNQIILSPGRYWLCYFSIDDYNIGNGGSLWWCESSLANNIDGSEPAGIDPSSKHPFYDVVWRAIKNNISDFKTKSFTLRDEAILSVDENTLTPAITIYPNPTHDIVNVSSDKNMEILNIVIYDVSGKALFKNSNSSTINISKMSNGIYFLEVFTENGRYKTKIVKY